MMKLVAAAALVAGSSLAGAATPDPVGDFLPTFTGAGRAELDFTSAHARFDGTGFDLRLELAGAPTGDAGVLHVWGIDRGAGTARLNALSDPDLDPALTWDALAVLFGDGTLRVVTFGAMGPPTITPIAGGAVVGGSGIAASVPLALLPGRGFAPTAYRFQPWSRLRADPLVDGPNTEIADLGPRLFAAVPEPAQWALMILGFGLVGAAGRRRARRGPGRPPLRAALMASALVGGGLLAAPAPSAPYAAHVVASGLNNPRGLTIGPDGALYIAESGVFAAGGPSTVIRGQTATLAQTGSITRVQNGVQQRIETGFASLTAPVLNDTSGPNDIAFAPDGTGYVVVGLGANPAVRSTDLAPGGGQLGQVYRFTGGVTPIGDIAAFELASNPTGGPIDSNPYSLAVWNGGLAIADAGSNALLNLDSAGTVSLIATFPPRFIGPPAPLSDSVPTGIVVGPDGNLYVAELTGFPFTPGAARIHRVTPGGGTSVAYEGFTTIADLAFGSDGTLFVLQLDDNGLATPGVGGSIVRVRTDGSRSTIFNQGLVFPTGLAIGSDGALYVSNFGNQAGRGEVLRVAPVPEPGTWAMLILGFGGLGAVARARRWPGAAVRPGGSAPAAAAPRPTAAGGGRRGSRAG
jgi:sugar lactone lactonase YvrE